MDWSIFTPSRDDIVKCNDDVIKLYVHLQLVNVFFLSQCCNHKQLLMTSCCRTAIIVCTLRSASAFRLRFMTAFLRCSVLRLRPMTAFLRCSGSNLWQIFFQKHSENIIGGGDYDFGVSIHFLCIRNFALFSLSIFLVIFYKKKWFLTSIPFRFNAVHLIVLSSST